MTTVNDQPLTRAEALRILREHKAELSERFGVQQVALFGSTARDDAHADSDVDILVGYDELPDWITYLSVQPFLEELFGRSVDVCTVRELHEEIRARVEAEAVYA